MNECTVFAFIQAGLVKDVFIVMPGVALHGETLVPQQHMAFFVCVSGVFFWSYSKTYATRSDGGTLPEIVFLGLGGNRGAGVAEDGWTSKEDRKFFSRGYVR